MKIVSKKKSLKHYPWGPGCEGWNLADERNFSVKLERMPPHSAEKNHYHEHAQQFFFVLDGQAAIEIEGRKYILNPREGIHILSRQKHKIMNQTDRPLEFLLSSHPSTHNDRINC